MNKLFKKVVASFLCLSFVTLQTSFAEAVFDNDFGGANIDSSHGGFTGVTKPNDNTADLGFNGDAVINWGNLNLSSEQILNFLNGDYAVLNNVLNGMSTIAGKITGENGMIIISNPNGMLMNGGSIETSGALILTTQDLVNKYSLDNGKLSIDWSNPIFKDNTYSIISLNAGKIVGGDINIIAKGIDVKSSDITSSGNISFKTSDGANFIAASGDASKTNGIKFNNGSSLQIANSSIKADANGVIDLIAGDANKANDNANVFVDGGSLTAKDVNISGQNIGVNASGETSTVINGNFVSNATGNSAAKNLTVNGDSTINSGKITSINNLKTNNLNATSGYNLDLKNSRINGDVTAVAGKNKNNPKPNASMFYMENSTVGGNLNASSETGYVHLNGGHVLGNATLAGNTSGDGVMGHIIVGYKGEDKDVILADKEAYQNSTTIGGTITAIANKGNRTDRPSLAKGDLLVYSDKSLVFDGGAIADNVIADSGENIMFNRGPQGVIGSTTTIGGNLTANAAGSNFIYDTTVGGDTTLNAGMYDSIVRLTTNNLIANAGYNIDLKDSVVNNNATVVAGKTTNSDYPNARMFYMENSKIDGNLDASSETGYVHLNGGSVAGNATLAGNTRGDGAMGHVIIGYKGEDKDVILADKEAYQNSTTIGGKITATANKGNRTDRPSLAKGDVLAYSDKNLIFDGGSIADNVIADSGENIMFNRGPQGVIGSTTTIGGNLTANAAGSNFIYDTNVGGDTTLNAGMYDSIVRLTTNNLIANAGYNIDLKDSVVNNNATVVAGKTTNLDHPNTRMFYMENSKIGGNLDASSETGYIHLNGGSVAGNATLAGNTRGDGAMGHIIIGYKGDLKDDILAIPEEFKNSTTIGGNITAIANKGNRTDSEIRSAGDVVAYSENDLKFVNSKTEDNFVAESSNGKVNVQKTDIGGDAKITANKGVQIWSSKVGKNLDATFTGDKSVGHPADRPTDPAHDMYIYNTTVKGDAKLTATNAADGAITVSNSTMENNLTAHAGGKVSLWQSSVGKLFKATSDNGSVYLSAADGARRTEVGSADLKAGKDVVLNNADVKGALTAKAGTNAVIQKSTVKGNADINAKTGIRATDSEFGGKAALTTEGNINSINTSYAGSITAKAENATFTSPKGGLNIINSDIKNNLNAETPEKVALWKSVVGGKFTANSTNGEVVVGQSQLGSADITSKENNRVYSTTVEKDIKMTSTNGNSELQNSTVKGNATILTDAGKAAIWNSTVNGKATLKSQNGEAAIGAESGKTSHVGSADIYGKKDVRFYNSTSDGELKIKSDIGNVNITNATVRNINATSNKANIVVRDSKTTGNSRNNFTAKNGNVTSKNTDYAGHIKVEAGKTAAFDSNNNLIFDSAKAKTFSATSNNGNIGVAGTVKADNIRVTAKNGSLLTAKDALLDGSRYQFEVGNNIGSTTDLENAMKNNGMAYDLTETAISGGVVEKLSAGMSNIHSNGDVKFIAPETTKSNFRVNSDGDITIQDGAKVAGSFLASSQGAITSTGVIDAGFDVKAYAANDVNLDTVNAGRSFVVNTKDGNITVNAGEIKGKSELTAANGNITSKDVTYKNDIKATAKNADFNSSKGSLQFVDSKISDNLNATANGKVGLWKSTVGKLFNAESKNSEVAVTSSEVGSADIKAKYNARFNDSTVKEGSLNMTSTNGAVTVKNSTINGDANLKTNNSVKGDINFIKNNISGKLDADAGHDVNYETTGNVTLNEAANEKLELKAGNSVNITTDGKITVDNLQADTKVVQGKNINLKGSDITSNNSSYNANVGMVAESDVTFTGNNAINGDLKVTSTGNFGFVAINGDSTTANNITVDKANWVEIKNVETGHLQLDNFNIGHIIDSTMDSTGFADSGTLYVHILDTIVNGKDLKPAITDSAVNVNKIIFYPESLTPGGGDGGAGGGFTSDDDASRLLGYMREKGTDGLVGKDFAPIAFAAYDRGRHGAIYKAAGDAIFKDLAQVVHITERFNVD